MSSETKAAGNRVLTLLAATTIAAAVTDQTSTAIVSLSGMKSLLVEAIFLYGSGGTTVKAWIQTRTQGGTWRDIMNFAFTTSAATKWSKTSVYAALTAAQATSDAALADDTILDGFLGSELRVKYTTTGTYAGATSLKVLATAKG